MAHVRTQIRHEIKAILDVVMTEHTVFSSRRYSLNASELPTVDMRVTGEVSQYGNMGTVKDRDATLIIRVSRVGGDDEVDDLLDADSVLIEHAIENQKLGGLVKSCVISESAIADFANGDKTLAELVLSVTVMYRTDIQDVETARA